MTYANTADREKQILRSIVGHYAAHKLDCALRSAPRMKLGCTCGLDEILARLKEATGEK